jgi:hypothetical protein
MTKNRAKSKWSDKCSVGLLTLIVTEIVQVGRVHSASLLVGSGWSDEHDETNRRCSKSSSFLTQNK